MVEENQVVKSETNTVGRNSHSALATLTDDGILGDDFDAGRGGWGHLKSQQEIETQRQQEQNELYSNQNNDEVPSGNHADSQVSHSTTIFSLLHSSHTRLENFTDWTAI